MRIKLDNRIRTLIENGIIIRHRSMFVIIGEKARDQVATLYQIMVKASTAQRPTVLWCYKNELEFSSHRKKRIKELKKKKQAGLIQPKTDDSFEQFILSTHINYCYYSESQRILGNTFGMAVLQDFEALTPNLLARTIETVEGGGLVVLLLQNMHSLKQLYTLTMDVHKRYRTELHSEIIPRFNERFTLSLSTCSNCFVIDDHLNVLPIFSNALNITPLHPNQKNDKSPKQLELQQLKQSLGDSKPIGPLLAKCKTYCQGKVLLQLLDASMEKTNLNSICSITAARGRGKSTAMGLAVAGTIGLGFSNICVTSPTPENLKTFFEFVLKGFEAIGYQEHADFEVVKSLDPAMDKCIVKINVFRRHRQTIQYITPTDFGKLLHAELVVIDEAAAIPMPLVKKLINGSNLVFLASTISGYEGSGRSLSLKLLEQLRKQQINNLEKEENNKNKKRLFELTLDESIRYGNGDPVEEWLNRMLCLNPSNLKNTISGTPAPEKCELYYVNRDALFSFHKAAEIFLSNLMSIYVAAHYKNSPDDLQLLSDAPAHHLFVLMSPIASDQNYVPQIMAVIQICLEGAISKQTVASKQGKKVAGDLIPWTICQQFLDNEFSLLYGARIVRLAVHPDFQGMGYGSAAVRMLQKYFKGDFGLIENLENEKLKKERDEKINKPVEEEEDMEGIEEEIIEEEEEEENEEEDNTSNLTPRTNLPPLLERLNQRRAESLDYIGVSFGLTLPLLKFWKRCNFVPLYIRQSKNGLTGEHNCIMINTITIKDEEKEKNLISQTINSDGTWLLSFFEEFRKRFISLLGICFNDFSPHMAFSLLCINSTGSGGFDTMNLQKNKKPISRQELNFLLSDIDLLRLSHYSRNMTDFNLIPDLLPIIANIYFNGRLEGKQNSTSFSLDLGQAAILLGVGLQRKSVDMVAKELELPVEQGYALLNKAIRRLSTHFDTICRDSIELDSIMEEQPESKHKRIRVSHFEVNE